MAMNCDVLIVGGGIAGLSLASELASSCSVVLVEAEQRLGYHTSSRSARQLIPSYGPAVVQKLTRRTLELLDAQLPEVLKPRSFMLVGTHDDVAGRFSDDMEWLSHAEALELGPQLRGESFEAAGIDRSAVGVDTDALLEYHRRRASDAGAQIFTGAGVHTAQQLGAGWSIGAGSHAFEARIVVNAAGAWADSLAVIAGVGIQGLRPYRRSAAVVRAENLPDDGAPMVAAADESFYFRREGDDLLISPAESVPSVPEDAQPNVAEIQALITRINALTTLGITTVQRAWTGLRTQNASGVPVVGFDPEAQGFFWLAGQGGYGFQTSSGIAELAAGIISGNTDAVPELQPS
ncbi:NAD(P)/FAD-dependent oxidoreductase [Arthrobacter roseus]|uniref:NAD(P)/FAD-dependent oxidoreductase n=1 Tax=Arthrobacter roseus TaxID=136274 RepID=UPI0019646729|nr:FAD-dependent oxidoreductase [Arthrobacter roseus]MBM7848134.1 glycine/D-amino acid oxidase-like deaminating enzyme [Arthrobacter roseus]